jgi:hypothetical protein
MKITPAVWEKRNLGVSCVEVTLDRDDDMNVVDLALAEVDAEYLVIKIPCNRTDLLFQLQTLGFTVAEVLSTCCHDGQLAPLSRVQKKILDSLTCARASSDDLETIYSELKNGMFTTDRVAVDPKFGIESAGRRYAGWLSDGLHRGSHVYSLTHKNLHVGFFVMEPRTPHEWYATLGGVFPQHQRSGFGYFMNYLEVTTAVAQGAKRIFTSFSSNNPAISAIHFVLGYRLILQQYVFIRHSSHGQSLEIK